MKRIAFLVFALLFGNNAFAQTDLGCVGTNGYRITKSGEYEYSPMLCEFDDTYPTDYEDYRPTLNETRRLYIERLPEALKQEVLEREQQEEQEKKEAWQNFLDQTGTSFD